MNWLSRVTALFRKRKLDAEFRFHLEMEGQQNLRNDIDTA